MMTLGTDNLHELADHPNEKLETHHAVDAQIVTAYQTMGDGFLTLGIFSLLAVNMNNLFQADSNYLACIKAGLLAPVSGYIPAVSIEFAQRFLMTKNRPPFFEVEEAVAAFPPV